MHESVSLSTTFRMGIRSGGFQAGSTEFFLGGGYLPSLRINHVAMNKRYRKNLPLLYYIKMKICYGLCFILTSEFQWQRNEGIRLIICLCISRYHEFFFFGNR